MALLVLSILLAGASLALLYMSRREGVLAAWAALACGAWSGLAYIGRGDVWFWLGAAVIAFAITLMLPRQVTASRQGVAHLATGALAGTVVGMLFNSQAAIILCAAAGVALGAMALGRMRQGQALGYPSRQYLNYVLAKGFPMLVTCAMLGILVINIINIRQ